MKNKLDIATHAMGMKLFDCQGFKINKTAVNSRGIKVVCNKVLWLLQKLL